MGAVGRNLARSEGYAIPRVRLPAPANRRPGNAHRSLVRDVSLPVGLVDAKEFEDLGNVEHVLVVGPIEWQRQVERAEQVIEPVLGKCSLLGPGQDAAVERMMGLVPE